jgi:hypothetical protein
MRNKLADDDIEISEISDKVPFPRLARRSPGKIRQALEQLEPTLPDSLGPSRLFKAKHREHIEALRSRLYGTAKRIGIRIQIVDMEDGLRVWRRPSLANAQHEDTEAAEAADDDAAGNDNGSRRRRLPRHVMADIRQAGG